MIRKSATLLVLASLILGVRLHYITYEYPDLDQAESMYHATKILGGSILYRDSFTHHHPGAIVASIIAGLFSNSHLATNWLSLILTLMTGGFVCLALLELVAPFAAILGALITTLAYFPADVPFYPQSMTAVFVALLLWLHVRTKRQANDMWFMRGLICGLAFAADQRCALLTLPVLWEVLAQDKRVLHRICLTVAGVILGFVPLLLYLILFDALNDYFYQCWVFPATVRTEGLALWSVMATGLKLHTRLNGGLVLACVAGLVCWLCKASKSLREFGYFGALAASLFAISAAGNETFSNYIIIWFPLFGFLCGILFSEIQSRFGMGEFLSGAIACLLILLSVGSDEVKAIFLGKYFRYNQEHSAQQAANFVRANIAPGEDLYVWGYYPQFYLYAGTLSRFRHVNQIAITGAYFSDDKTPHFEPTTTPAFAEFEKYMTKTPPRFFVIYDDVQSWKTFDQRIIQARTQPSNHLHLLSTFVFDQLEANYKLDRKEGNFHIYKSLRD